MKQVKSSRSAPSVLITPTTCCSDIPASSIENKKFYRPTTKAKNNKKIHSKYPQIKIRDTKILQYAME